MEGNIIVLAFEGASTAENMLTNFEEMQEKGWLTIEDAALATCSPSRNVEIKQTQSLTGKYTARGGGIGLLAGLLLGGPIGGLVGGTIVGAIAGALKDYGIDDKFIQEITEALKPDSSALFLMGEAHEPESVLEELRPFKAVVASTTLAPEQENRLKKALAEEE